MFGRIEKVIGRRASLLPSCLAFGALAFGHAAALWAQVGAEEEPQAAWVTAYALVILSVGMGLFVICRPGKRSKKVKAEGS